MIKFETIIDLWKNGHKLEVEKILDETVLEDKLEPPKMKVTK